MDEKTAADWQAEREEEGRTTLKILAVIIAALAFWMIFIREANDDPTCGYNGEGYDCIAPQ